MNEKQWQKKKFVQILEKEKRFKPHQKKSSHKALESAHAQISFSVRKL